MTPTSLAIARAVQKLRASGKRATPHRIAAVVHRHNKTVAAHIENLIAEGILTESAFLGDVPHGVRLTGKGKAILGAGAVQYGAWNLGGG